MDIRLRPCMACRHPSPISPAIDSCRLVSSPVSLLVRLVHILFFCTRVCQGVDNAIWSLLSYYNVQQPTNVVNVQQRLRLHLPSRP